MSTELFFYQLGDLDPPNVIARLCARARDQGWRCAILAAPEHHHMLSTALWTAQAESFLPHEILPSQEDAPIIISDAQTYETWIKEHSDSPQEECILFWQNTCPMALTTIGALRLCYFFSQQHEEHLAQARNAWKMAKDQDAAAKYLVYQNSRWHIEAQNTPSTSKNAAET